jgi:acyl carrier protein
MATLSESQFTDLVMAWVLENKRSGNEDVKITVDTDLLGSGILDSFGFVDLIVYIESLNGCRIDLADADPSEFTVIRGLCRLALKDDQVGASHAAGRL